MKHNDELESYKDAVWAYIVEHSDVTDRGSFFVKFHTQNRKTFENHILARWKYGYHRKDDRLNLDYQAKERHATALQQAHQSRKIAKRRQHMLSRDERIKAMKGVEEENTRRIALARAQNDDIIHTRTMQPLAQKWYNVVIVWLLNRLIKKILPKPVTKRVRKHPSNLSASTAVTLQKTKVD